MPGYFAKEHRLTNLTLQPSGPNPLSAVKAEQVEILATFEPGKADSISFNLRGVSLSYDVRQGMLRYGKINTPVPAQEGRVTLHMLLDQTSLEIFANSGLTYIPAKADPIEGNRDLAVQAKGGTAKFTTLEVYPLKSIWR